MKKRGSEKRNVNAANIIVAFLFSIILYPASWIAVWLWNLGDMVINGADYYGDTEMALYALFLTIIISVALLINDHLKSPKQKQIEAEFNKDKTSICPHCGSRNIKTYPKGYDYKFAFWGSILGSKSAPFLAGIDSNIVCCRCRNCGKNWETPYNYK